MSLETRGTTLRQSVVLKPMSCEWEIACHGSSDIDSGEIQPLRRQFAESWTGPGRGSMRHMEDQTVAAMEAVRLARAMNPQLAFGNWAVLACPLLPGRATFRENLKRYAEEGAFAISPQVIPQCSLHSLPGQLSIVLGAHGPNLGVGGWPGTEDQVWSTAWAIEKAIEPDGLWLVWTCQESDLPGAPNTQRIKAFALAIRRGDSGIVSRWRASLESHSGEGIAWSPWNASEILSGVAPSSTFQVGGGSLALRFLPPDEHS